MTSETETWKLEKDLCRCCHAEGCFQNLGQRCSNSNELLSDMLRTCFDIEISPVTGLLCALTFTICEQCVARLRDASSFKHQVLRCEERFKHMYRNLGKVLNPDIAVKLEEEPSTLHNDVKEEPSAEEDDFDVNFAVDDDDDEDDDKTVLALQLEAAQKAKRGKAKEKKAPPKAKRKGKSEAPAESNAEEKPKRGGYKYVPKYVLKDSDYTKDGDIYTCTHCEAKYAEVRSLRLHVKKKHIPNCPCQLCKRQFTTPVQLVVHKLEAHGIDDRFKCKACNGAFNSKKQLRKHINHFHMLGEKFKCESCDYEAYSVERLRRHNIKHKTVKDHHCRYCKKSFLRKTTLNFHERIHTGDRRKVCEVCGQAFVQKASLNYHMTKYHPEVNF